MAFKDMREFLASLDKAGQLKNVDVQLDCAHGTNELQALMRHLAEINGPG
jgi:3-polyprenyl-4-hydroxybenzoate decarboxylase